MLMHRLPRSCGRASAERKDTMRKQHFIPRLGAVLGLVLLASACGSSKKDVYVERPVEELYNRAMDKFRKGEIQVAPAGDAKHCRQW